MVCVLEYAWGLLSNGHGCETFRWETNGYFAVYLCISFRIIIIIKKNNNNNFKTTLLEVGEAALGFFFLILIPGTGAELRASRKPKLSIANAIDKQMKCI